MPGTIIPESKDILLSSDHSNQHVGNQWFYFVLAKRAERENNIKPGDSVAGEIMFSFARAQSRFLSKDEFDKWTIPPLATIVAFIRDTMQYVRLNFKRSRECLPLMGMHLTVDRCMPWQWTKDATIDDSLVISTLQDNDAVFENGRLIFGHYYLSSVLNLHRSLYTSARNVEDAAVVVDFTISQVCSQGGRFLKQDSHGAWSRLAIDEVTHLVDMCMADSSTTSHLHKTCHNMEQAFHTDTSTTTLLHKSSHDLERSSSEDLLQTPFSAVPSSIPMQTSSEPRNNGDELVQVTPNLVSPNMQDINPIKKRMIQRDSDFDIVSESTESEEFSVGPDDDVSTQDNSSDHNTTQTESLTTTELDAGSGTITCSTNARKKVKRDTPLCSLSTSQLNTLILPRHTDEKFQHFKSLRGCRDMGHMYPSCDLQKSIASSSMDHKEGDQMGVAGMVFLKQMVLIQREQELLAERELGTPLCKK